MMATLELNSAKTSDTLEGAGGRVTISAEGTFLEQYNVMAHVFLIKKEISPVKYYQLEYMEGTVFSDGNETKLARINGKTSCLNMIQSLVDMRIASLEVSLLINGVVNIPRCKIEHATDLVLDTLKELNKHGRV